MGRFNLEQRWQILKCYFQSNCCVAETVRRLKNEFGPDKVPTAAAISVFVKKVRETGMLIDNKNYHRTCPKRSPSAIAVVAKSVQENPDMSIRHRSQKLGMSYTTVRKIMLDDLGLVAYKTTKEEKISNGNSDDDDVMESHSQDSCEIESDEYEKSLDSTDKI